MEILLLPTTCLDEVPREPCCESLKTWSSAMIMLNCVQSDLRFKYVDDLTILELLSLSPCSGNLSSYNCKLHVPSDIGTDQLNIHQSNLLTQNHINTISELTRINKIMLNSAKYMIYTRRYGSLCTRLNLESNILEKVSATKRLGV